MKKIVVRKAELFEEFLAIFALGLTSCLEKDFINTRRAEEWLFSPVIGYSEKSFMENNVGKDLINALQKASSLGYCVGVLTTISKMLKRCEICS